MVFDDNQVYWFHWSVRFFLQMAFSYVVMQSMPITLPQLMFQQSLTYYMGKKVLRIVGNVSQYQYVLGKY